MFFLCVCGRGECFLEAAGKARALHPPSHPSKQQQQELPARTTTTNKTTTRRGRLRQVHTQARSQRNKTKRTDECCFVFSGVRLLSLLLLFSFSSPPVLPPVAWRLPARGCRGRGSGRDGRACFLASPPAWARPCPTPLPSAVPFSRYMQFAVRAFFSSLFDLSSVLPPSLARFTGPLSLFCRLCGDG